MARLQRYLPEGCASRVFLELHEHKVHLKIKKPRKSKLGDYRHPYGPLGHRISINGNLNPYSFLITLLHEMAHMLTWEQRGNRAVPHGAEWKQNFRQILNPFVQDGTFPTDITSALDRYVSAPKASSCTDLHLARALAKYDQQRLPNLESLPKGSLFKLSNGKLFEKGPLLRKRYRCQCLTDKRWFYVSALAEVQPIDKSALAEQ